MEETRIIKRVGHYSIGQASREDCKQCHNAKYATVLVDGVCLDCLLSSQLEPPVGVQTAEVRRLPEQKPRVETGVTVFGDDWQGLFLRGDYCADLLGKLSKLLNGDISPIEKEIIYEFHELLKKVKE